MTRSSLEVRLRGPARGLEVDAALASGDDPIVLIGPNGAGKTTLLLMMLGAIPARSGYLEAGGAVLYDSARSIAVPIEDRRIGYVPQSSALFGHLTVRQNVAFAAKSAASAETRGEREERAEGLLDELGLRALADRPARALSGGEGQRVAIARALAMRPRALLLDEPLGALDATARAEVRAYFASYVRLLGLPTVVVSHAPEDARALGGRVAVMEAGRVVQTASWEELEAAPATAFAAAFVRA